MYGEHYLEDADIVMYDVYVSVTVNALNPGEGTLQATVRGPNANKDDDYNVRIKKVKDGLYEISYRPVKFGDYFLNVLWESEHVFGSPFKMEIDEKSFVDLVALNGKDITECITLDEHIHESPFDYILISAQTSHLEKLMRLRDENREKREKESYLLLAELNGKDCIGMTDDVYVSVTVNALNPGEGTLQATVQGPNANKNDDHDVRIWKVKEGLYEISYRPVKFGDYFLNVLWEKKHVFGSPFKMEIDEKSFLNLFEQGGKKITEGITLDKHVTESPFAGILLSAEISHLERFILSRVVEDDKSFPELVVLDGKGLTEGIVGQSVHFTVDGRNAGYGEVNCKCRAPSGKFTDVSITRRTDDRYKVELNVMEVGLHTVDIKWGEKTIPGSPFTVKIMYPQDIGRVKAYGPGLTSGVIERFEGIFYVDTKGSGEGFLKVGVCGPKKCFKVKLSRNNPKDRVIKVQYNPTCPGIYTANVFWSDEHITGSPFEIFIAAKESHLEKWKRSHDEVPEKNVDKSSSKLTKLHRKHLTEDTGNVRAYGPGLMSGVFDKFRAIFYVDTKGSGAGFLEVGVCGPKKCFKVKLSRNNPKDRIINVQYNPTCPGIYTANVFWADEHITGSPFLIFIAAKKSHLEKWKRSHYDGGEKEIKK